MNKMKIKNINKDLIKRSTFKVCFGISMIGVLATGYSTSKDYLRRTIKPPERSESTVNEDEYSTVTCNYVGDYDYINNADIVVITSKQDSDDKYTTVSAMLDAGAPSVDLKPGEYSVLCDLGKIDMTIDDVNEEYSVTIDYGNNIFECNKIEKQEQHTK